MASRSGEGRKAPDAGGNENAGSRCVEVAAPCLKIPVECAALRWRSRHQTICPVKLSKCSLGSCPIDCLRSLPLRPRQVNLAFSSKNVAVEVSDPLTTPGGHVEI